MPPVERRRAYLEPIVIMLAALPLLYFSGYVFARVTHRLVWYGDFVARPNAMSGIGWTEWELFYAPACWTEAKLRRL